ncbi:MAG: hypothetical protein AAF799_02365 [Myxococcota bacterium]
MTTPPPLSEHARDRLASVRELREPIVDIEQSLAAVHERIGTQTPPPGGTAGSGGALKLAGGLAASVVVGAATWMLLSSAQPQTQPPADPVAVTQPPESVEPEPPHALAAAPTPAPAAAKEPSTTTTVIEASAPPSTSETKPAAPRRTARRRRVQAPSGEDALTAELRLIDRARGQLRARRFDAAIRSLERHARTFPYGQLVDERNVMLVEALCGDGQTERARSKAQAFLAAAPGSPFAPRLRDSCAH